MFTGFFTRFCPVLLAASFCAGCSLTSAPIYEGQTKNYSVQRGDTLFDIASSCRMQVDTLADLNELDHPDRLSVGQVLRIPADAQVIPASLRRPSMDTFRAPGAESASEPAAPVDLTRSPAAASFGKLIWPVEGGKAGSRFGTRDGNFHEGLDIRAETGTPILAAHDGEVVFSGNAWSGYGNMIVLKGQGIYTVYAHNHQNYVSAGDTVFEGDQMGTVGCTGRATGSHLHFEVRVDDPRGFKVAVNPALFIKQRESDLEPVMAVVLPPRVAKAPDMEPVAASDSSQHPIRLRAPVIAGQRY